MKNLKEKRVGNSLKFLIPNGAKTNRGSDVDYGNYFISKKINKRKVWMAGIHGPSATLGIPSEEWILNATEFTERSYDGRYFSDTRGRAKDGSYWRYIGAFGEQVEYSGLTAEEAKYFDAIITTACK